MKESFLQLLWEQQLFSVDNLRTVENEVLKVHEKGVVNTLRGPDFSHAVITLANQKWAGNIEVHVKSSDWYAHKHQKDENYNNVILHVVYEHDIDVYDLHSNIIPTLELKKYIPVLVLKNYTLLTTANQKWVLCEDYLSNFDTFKWKLWLERLYIERLERKVEEVSLVFKEAQKDWEATLFLMLAKYFGGHLNGSYFYNAFTQVNFTLIRKLIANKNTSPMLYGLLGLLEDKTIEDAYYQYLQKEFAYQKQKHGLKDLSLPRLHFYGCRPPNFPTVRIAQLIAFYETHQKVFYSILGLKEKLKENRTFFNIEVNSYWETHYNFGKVSKESSKKMSKNFTDLLLMNVIIPVLFLYHKTKGEDDSYLLELMYTIAPEKNSIITKFQELNINPTSALETQALLTLKKEYCDKERCAACAVGADFITGKG